MDKRSTVTTVTIKEAETLLARISENVGRCQSQLDKLKGAGKVKINVMYWSSGLLADAKLARFLQGLDKAE
jgi:hypothetical protein